MRTILQHAYPVTATAVVLPNSSTTVLSSTTSFFFFRFLCSGSCLGSSCGKFFSLRMRARSQNFSVLSVAPDTSSVLSWAKQSVSQLELVFTFFFLKMTSIHYNTNIIEYKQPSTICHSLISVRHDELFTSHI